MEPRRLRILAGPNGSGKTTLLRILQGLEVPLGTYINADDIESELKRSGTIALKDFDLNSETFITKLKYSSSKLAGEARGLPHQY